MKYLGLWWNIPCEWTQVRRSKVRSRTPTRYNSWKKEEQSINAFHISSGFCHVGLYHCNLYMNNHQTTFHLKIDLDDMQSHPLQRRRKDFLIGGGTVCKISFVVQDIYGTDWKLRGGGTCPRCPPGSYAYALCRIHFGQYQASSAVLEWPSVTPRLISSFHVQEERAWYPLGVQTVDFRWFRQGASNQVAEQKHMDTWLSKGVANKNYTAKDKEGVIGLWKTRCVNV